MRVALQALAAVLGGTQSLHTNGYDEALGLPTERGGPASRCARSRSSATSRGVVDTPDPLAGSYFVESLTDEVERLAWEYIDRIDEMGGAVAAIEAGYQMDEIEQAAYEYTKSIDDDERVIVGVNKFTLDDEPEPTVFPIDPALERGQRERLADVQGRPRRGARSRPRLDDVVAAARGTQNLLYPMKEALRANATLGEVSDALRGVFGVYHLAADDWLEPFGEVENCYVTTTGRRTGNPHEIEIWFGVSDGTLYLISGNGPTADWYRNLIAEPEVTVRIDDQIRNGTARVVTDADERRRVGDLMGAKYVWGGDPDIGLTYQAWCYEVPAVAIEF